MFKKLLAIALLLFTTASFAQEYNNPLRAKKRLYVDGKTFINDTILAITDNDSGADTLQIWLDGNTVYYKCLSCDSSSVYPKLTWASLPALPVYVDSLWRNATGDSLIWSIAGRIHAIKDSTGGGSATATGVNYGVVIRSGINQYATNYLVVDSTPSSTTPYVTSNNGLLVKDISGNYMLAVSKQSGDDYAIFQAGDVSGGFNQTNLDLFDDTKVINLAADNIMLYQSGYGLMNGSGSDKNLIIHSSGRIDTTALAIVPADTSAMLSHYIDRADTASMLTPYIDRADTASMLSPYLLESDTATMLSHYIDRADTASMLTSYIDRSDTASMLTPYARLNSPTFTGTPTLPSGSIGTTQSAADNSTKLATTAFVTTADNLKANLASPTFTGTPTVPTASQSTNTTQIASTAYVYGSLPIGSRYTISQAIGTITAGVAANTFIFTAAGAAVRVNSTAAAQGILSVYIDDAYYPAMGGNTARLAIHADIYTNNVAPTGNFTFGLYPVTVTSGAGAGLVNPTLGTVVSGSTATFTTPAANSVLSVSSSTFAIPADGVYSIGLVTTGTIAASAYVTMVVYIQVTY